MFRHQILVIGGGLAGMRAAIEASAMADVAIVSKVHPIRSHSDAAQGGINAALRNHPQGIEDSTERHAYDTIKGSDFLADQKAAFILTEEAPERVIESEHWGVPFSRFDNGRIAQRPFGGAGFPRTCFSADRTGHMLIHTMYEQTIKRGITLYSEWQMLALVVQDGRCHGIIALNRRDGEIASFSAEAVILATGGMGRLYSRTTNAIVNTGSGMAIAYWAGLPLKDMEFTQFHPTTLFGTNILASEGARGEGGLLRNAQGDRFMRRYAPAYMELAPRDIVSRAIQTEINEGRGFDGSYVHLDLRELGEKRINERLPEVRDICRHFAGIDPVKEPIPIQPGQHYHMGGIDCGIDGETIIKGLYAAGECACVSVHGANRLGGNSLLETLVFGKRAGERAAQQVKEDPIQPDEKALTSIFTQQQERVNLLLEREPSYEAGMIRNELRSTMADKVGIFRDRQTLQEAQETIRRLKDRFQHIGIANKGKLYNLDLARTLELEGKIAIAEVMVEGALAREESRGGHFRTDFSKRDDEKWLKHTLAHWTEKGPSLTYSPVDLSRIPIEAREY